MSDKDKDLSAENTEKTEDREETLPTLVELLFGPQGRAALFPGQAAQLRERRLLLPEPRHRT